MTTSSDDRLALNLLVQGFKISRMLGLVADLMIADRIPPGGSCRITDLAPACGVLSEPLRRAVRALAAFRSSALGQMIGLAIRPGHFCCARTCPTTSTMLCALGLHPHLGAHGKHSMQRSRAKSLMRLLGAQRALPIYGITPTKPAALTRSWPITLTTDTVRWPPLMTSQEQI
jgi:hypothetical protein